MVSISYLIDNPGKPGPAKLWFDQQAIPAAIDLLGGVEAALERVAALARSRPRETAAAALAVGCLLGLMAQQPLRRR